MFTSSFCTSHGSRLIGLPKFLSPSSKLQWTAPPKASDPLCSWAISCCSPPAAGVSAFTHWEQTG